MHAFLANGKVLEAVLLKGGYIYLRVETPNLKPPKPGQFYMLGTNDNSKILNRPISLNHYEDGVIDFIIKILGNGTKEISQFKVGDSFPLQGPLGKGFFVPAGDSEVVVVGGGVGIAPLKELMNALHKAGNTVHFVGGARSKDDLESNLHGFDGVLSKVKSVRKFTDDGSGDYEKGFVNQGLREVLNTTKIHCIYSCGPAPMLKTIAVLGEEFAVRTQLSFESRMGCGVGACMCCSIKTADGQKRVCKEGPVFERESIIFL